MGLAGVAGCARFSAGGGVADLGGAFVAGFGAASFAGSLRAAGSDGWTRRSGVAGARFAIGGGGGGGADLAAGRVDSAVFFMGSAGFVGSGAFARAAAGRAGITGAIGLPSGMGLASTETAGRP